MLKSKFFTAITVVTVLSLVAVLVMQLLDCKALAIF